MEKKHTPAPWSWILTSQGVPYLATPNRGCLYVMDFARKGMQSATPRFAHWNGIDVGEERGRTGGIMMDIQSFTERYGDHPDALLIEAAPDLFEAVEKLLPFVYDKLMDGETDYEKAILGLVVAYKKAKGTS